MGVTAFISIGSNLGAREEMCREAAVNLAALSEVTILKESSLYESLPWGRTDQGAFINSVVIIDTTFSAEELLVVLKKIEAMMGRVKADDVGADNRWGPRVIDLDILTFGDLVVDTEELTIPHKYLHERAFVLLPLAEIAPELRHPVSGKTVEEQLLECGDLRSVKKI